MSDKTRPALLPCPFCGEALSDQSKPIENPDGSYQVWCDHCHADGPESEDEAAAVERWNRRTALSAQKPLPEHWMTAELRDMPAAYQRAAREYAEDYARAAISAQPQEDEPKRRRSARITERFYEHLKSLLGATTHEQAAAEIGRLQGEVHCWRTRGRAPMLSDPENAAWLEAEKQRMRDDPAYARSLLQEAGIVGPTGGLTQRFGGTDPDVPEDNTGAHRVAERPEDLRTHAASFSAQKPQAETVAREAAAWRALTEPFVDEFLEDYEMVGEDEDGRDALHVPTEGERALIKDAIMGLLQQAYDAAPLAAEAPRPAVGDSLDEAAGILHDVAPDYAAEPRRRRWVVAAEAPEPVAWKCGNEVAPFHPQASHVRPDYRDGWNDCYRAIYAAQPQKAPQPLTAKRLRQVLQETAEGIDSTSIIMTHWPIVARAIERAHGIGTKPEGNSL